MKKAIWVLVLLSVFIPETLASADVTGWVQLNAKRKDFPSSLTEVFQGRNSKLPFGKKGKKVKVTASYDGDRVLTLEEDTDLADSEKRYFFDIPIPSVVGTFSSKLAKASTKFGSVKVRFESKSDSDDDDDDFDSVDDVFNSSSSLLSVKNKKAKKKIKPNFSSSVNSTLSVKKILATRKGLKAKAAGLFNNSNKAAKGRFKLKFVFDSDDD